ncbi:MAG TPA: type II toxin-antitoxin system HicB family antitoxin, partial [Pirellulales bacterium]
TNVRSKGQPNVSFGPCGVLSRWTPAVSAVDRPQPTEVRSPVHLKVVFEPSDEGGYTAHVPALPGCISEGDTLDEARKNIREAIELYLEFADDATIPAGSVVEEVAV